MEIELNIPETEITGKDISVETGNTNIAVSEDTKDLDITYNRKEYSIIGDGIFISSVLDDVPEWLGDLIDSTLEAAILSRDQNLINRMEAILTALDYVPKNRYTEQINQIVDEDGIINTRIATLNSNLTDALTTANATIAEINLTYASKNEAAAIATNVLTASLSADGEIGSTLIELQTAYADLESTTAESITLLESVMEGEINGNASAMQTVRSYVGIDEAGASTGTGLSAYLEDSNGVIGGADSKVVNNVYVDNNGNSRSKFEYNSSLNIGGNTYNSGFGLSNSAGTGVGSEFWINAEKFKFTNTNKTGSVAPFTIDTSESQPQITFNGKVTFGSGQVGTIDQAIAAVVETVAVGDKNINITDNLIPTTSLVADTDNSGYQFIGTPTKSMSAGLESFSEAQIILDGSDEAYSPYVDEVTIPYYYRFGIKGITNLDRFKVVTINASNVVTYNNVTVTMEVGKTLSTGNWYTVDGIINPLGGTTTADGDIRDINGVKVGSINNFVMPSGTTKVLLGWIADCTISRMKMCKITADTITSDFSSVNGQLVDLNNQVSNIGWDNLSGKDVLAQKFGYATYSALESAATAGETVVVGGKINTELIEVNAINANQINTTGLIAENISADEINGKTFNGGVFNGARINGAVIKASYLDLDGDLEVLTNYHITVAMRNANPSLYTDAVYISADNEYRIPSISTIYNSGSATQFYAQNNVVKYMYISDQIRSYNTANVGHNTKAVRIDPKINILTSSTYYYSDRSNIWQPRSRSNDLVLPLCSFYINNIEVARCYHYFMAGSGGQWQARIFDVQNGNTLSTSTKSWGQSISFTVAISNGLSITINIDGSLPPYSDQDESIYKYTIKLNQCIVTPINQFTSGNLLHMSYYSYYGAATSFPNRMESNTYAYNPASNISINNMI